MQAGGELALEACKCLNVALDLRKFLCKALAYGWVVVQELKESALPDQKLRPGVRMCMATQL